MGFVRTTKLRERLTERMELRVRPSAKRTIRRAMALSGKSAADLALDAALRVLDESQRVRLSGEDRKAFLDLIARPPAPNARLKRAFRRHAAATR